MSRTSYPSPASSVSSPPLASNAALTPPSDDPETAFLQHSEALRTAYERIRRVRRSLLDMSNHNVDNNRQPTDIGPEHESIILTGSPTTYSHLESEEDRELERLRNSLPMDRLRQYEMSLSDRGRPARTNPSHSAVVAPLESVTESVLSSIRNWQNSPVSPPRAPLLSRRSLGESQLIRRRELSDDPNTVLGRHVAAREAAGTTERGTTERAPAIWQLVTDHPNRISPATMERDLELFRTIARQRRSEPGNRGFYDHRRVEDDTRTARSLDATTHVANGGTPASIPGARSAWSSRRMRRNDSSRQPQSAVSQDRLSLLSNFSVQNFASPVSAISQQPLLFEEPTSYADRAADEIDNSRRYYVRRNLNSDGAEVVHNVNVHDWDDETQLPWLMSSTNNPNPSDASGSMYMPRMYRRSLASRDANASSSRGWARIDADGNDIPSDEEEALENARTEERIRLHQQGTTAPHLIPMTRNSFAPDDDEYIAPRVRLRHDSRTDRPVRQARFERKEKSLPSPIYDEWQPDPLPMPPSIMLCSGSPRPSNSEGTQIPKHAIMAGR